MLKKVNTIIETIYICSYFELKRLLEKMYIHVEGFNSFSNWLNMEANN